jgi:hypothetical protein
MLIRTWIFTDLIKYPPTPLVIMLSLIDVKGRHLLMSDRVHIRHPEHAFDRDTVILPELIVDDLNVEPKKLLLPLIEILWQAGGHQRSPSHTRAV